MELTIRIDITERTKETLNYLGTVAFSTISVMKNAVPNIPQRTTSVGDPGTSKPETPKAEETPPLYHDEPRSSSSLELGQIKKALAKKIADGRVEEARLIINEYGLRKTVDVSPEKYAEIMARIDGIPDGSGTAEYSEEPAKEA
jgi:hypothetical protein